LALRCGQLKNAGFRRLFLAPPLLGELLGQEACSRLNEQLSMELERLRPGTALSMFINEWLDPLKEPVRALRRRLGPDDTLLWVGERPPPLGHHDQFLPAGELEQWLNTLPAAAPCPPPPLRIPVYADPRTRVLLDSSPNGLLFLDRQLVIADINPAFKDLFHCSQRVVGQPLNHLMDPEPFEELVLGNRERIESLLTLPDGRIVQRLVYRLPMDEALIGIFVDMTSVTRSQEALDIMKTRTLARARKLLHHQIDGARQMVRMLAGYTAESQTLLEELLETSDGALKDPELPHIHRDATHDGQAPDS